MLQVVKRTIKHAWLFTKSNIATAAELRSSFMIEAIGMMLNDIAFVIVWVFFFNTVGTINDWSAVEIIGLEGVVTTAFGITYFFAGGIDELARYVNNGNFDNFLLSPVNLYIRIITCKTSFSAFGDFLFGVILLIMFIILAKLSLLMTILLLIMVVSGAFLFINFNLFMSLIAFLIPDASDVTKTLRELILYPSLFPSGLFSKPLRIFFLFVFPALAMSGVPVEIVRHPRLDLLLIVLGISAFWSISVYFLLKKVVRRYESGNLTGIKS